MMNAEKTAPHQEQPELVVSAMDITNEGMDAPFLKGEVQEPAYRDINFARAFYVQVIGVLLTACLYGPVGFRDNDEEGEGDENNNNNNQAAATGDGTDGTDGTERGSFFFILFISVIGSILGIMGFLHAMLRYSHEIIKICLFTAPVFAFCIGLLLMMTATTDDSQFTAMMFLFFAVIFAVASMIYYFCFSRFIPFASSTLHSAMTALRVNRGLYVLSFVFLMAIYLWTFVWLIAFFGIVANAHSKGQELCSEKYPNDEQYVGSDEMCDIQTPNFFAILLLILALYWTQQVLQNVLHCTTAGAVGSWWFSTFGDPSCWSREVGDSLGRSLTYSFGSICFGSLLVAIIQLLESMARSARRNRRGAILACILECILHLIRRWIEYFNSWAFVYVGIYGYDYLTAGKNVIAMFQAQGWSAFISDRLVYRVLYSVHIGVGLMAGCAALLGDMATGPVFGKDDVDSDSDSDSDTADMSHMACFFLGLIIGMILSSVSLFVVESATRSIIVCFAESPMEFQEHHPDLCEEMKQGWSQAYPQAWNDEVMTERFNKTSSSSSPVGKTENNPLV